MHVISTYSFVDYELSDKTVLFLWYTAKKLSITAMAQYDSYCQYIPVVSSYLYAYTIRPYRKRLQQRMRRAVARAKRFSRCSKNNKYSHFLYTRSSLGLPFIPNDLNLSAADCTVCPRAKTGLEANYTCAYVMCKRPETWWIQIQNPSTQNGPSCFGTSTRVSLT